MLSTVTTSMTALSHCSPFIETFGKKFGERLAGRVVGWAAAELFAARAALVFASLEISIFVLLVSLAIFKFEDDALQNGAIGAHSGSREIITRMPTEERMSNSTHSAQHSRKHYDRSFHPAVRQGIRAGNR